MKRNLILIGIILVAFGAVYASISLLNHYYFRTFTNDLGIFNQAAYHYSTFQWNTNTAKIPTTPNLLSDHLSIILIPLSFSRYLFGTYSLLVMQIIFVLIGGYGCYRLLKVWRASEFTSMMAMLHFLSFFGVFSAIGFDYHNNVIAASLLPWFFFFIHQNKKLPALIFALLIMSCKENFPLYMAAISFGILIGEPRLRKENLSVLFFIFFFGVFYFLLAVKYIMPALDDGKPYEYFRYGIIGSDWGDGIKNMVRNPFQALKLLFVNHTNDPFYDQTKSNFFLFFAISGGVFSILNPRYLPATLFIIVQKMYYDNQFIWGVASQYSVALAPLASIALFDAIRRIELKWLQHTLSVLSFLIAISSTIYIFENDIMAWADKNRYKFYDQERYIGDYDLPIVHQALKLIPENAKVSAEYNIVPHLAFRDHIYQFPSNLDVDYVVLFHNDGKYYPAKKGMYDKALKKLIKNPNWKIIFESKDLLILEVKGQ